MIAFQLVLFLGQACIVVLGWAVVHYLSERRDRRKARLELLTRSIDDAWILCDELWLAARIYHSTVRDVGRELEIKVSFQALRLRTESFSDLCRDMAELAVCRNAVFSMRLSVTATHFEGRHTLPMDDTNDLFWTMADQTMRVKRAFLKLKHIQFPKR
jgi:hypothetical protein